MQIRKERDAERNDKCFLSANFDLEAVLYSPLFSSKLLFYKRKKFSFNFTVYCPEEKRALLFLGRN